LGVSVAKVEALVQPEGPVSLGGRLLTELANVRWQRLSAAVAYVKRSGVRHIAGPLDEFCARNPGAVDISVGIDQQGSSLEGVQTLFQIVQQHGSRLFVVHDPTSSPSPTFHPKIWMFSDGTDRLVLVGSGNLTQGGFFVNYEAGIAVELDGLDPDDAPAVATYEAALTAWTNTANADVVALDVAALQSLHDTGALPSESMLRRAATAASTARSKIAGSNPFKGVTGTLFGAGTARNVPVAAPQPALAPPPVTPKAPVPLAPVVAVPAGGPTSVHSALVMVVRPQAKTEIYLTKGVLAADPTFFGAPFTGLTVPKSPTNPGQPQAHPQPLVSITVYDTGGAVLHSVTDHPLKMWVYANGPSANDDFRITIPSDFLASVPNDSILMMRRNPANAALDYTLEFFPPGHPDHPGLLASCTSAIPNSPRRYGWS
jgi:hypothetical protein